MPLKVKADVCETLLTNISNCKPGDTFILNRKNIIIKMSDVLPLIQNEFSNLFIFDTFENPKLKQLRTQENLDEVIAQGKDEFEKQILLLDWVSHRIKKFGKPTSKARGGLDILKDVDEGHMFYCSHYGDLMVSSSASLGWVARELALRRPDNDGTGSTEHTTTEIWSNQYRKWIMFDPTYAMYCEKDDLPLSAYEVRQEWFYGKKGKDLVFVIGAERKKHTKKDLPILRAHYPGHGKLQLTSNTMNKYAFIGYIPNTNFMDAGVDYRGMFITRDELCDGTKWHKRILFEDPSREPYFPINHAVLNMTSHGEMNINVNIKTLTPNFKTFQIRVDGKKWIASKDTINWVLHNGKNTFEARSINKFDVHGPVSMIELQVED